MVKFFQWLDIYMKSINQKSRIFKIEQQFQPEYKIYKIIQFLIILLFYLEYLKKMLISDFFYNSYLLNYKYFEEKHFILKITLKKFFLEKSYFLISPKLSIFRHKDVILSFRLISPKLSICEGKSHCFRGHFGKIPDSITLI